jgi:hypothetical protein
MKIQQEAKDKLIAEIVDNSVEKDEEKQAAKDMLANKSMEDLELIKSFQPAKPQKQEQPKPNYAGAAGAPPTNNSGKQTEQDEDILPLPTVNYGA